MEGRYGETGVRLDGWCDDGLRQQRNVRKIGKSGEP